MYIAMWFFSMLTQSWHPFTVNSPSTVPGGAVTCESDHVWTLWQVEPPDLGVQFSSGLFTWHAGQGLGHSKWIKVEVPKMESGLRLEYGQRFITLNLLCHSKEGCGSLSLDEGEVILSERCQLDNWINHNMFSGVKRQTETKNLI